MTLSPRKFATISVFTREMFQHSTPNIEQVVRAVLSESVGLALDSALLDATAGDGVRPAGLRNGIAAKTKSTQTVRSEAMLEDVATLVGAVAAIAGNTPAGRGQPALGDEARDACLLTRHGGEENTLASGA